MGHSQGPAMASDESSGPRSAAPIVLRIKLRYDDVEGMLQRFATNVGKSGLFLPTRSIQPVGSEVKFELRLADDTPALVGLGRVKATTPPDPDQPKAAFGMTIELMRVTPQSRALILRMLERRRALGLPDISLPTAADIDAARRAEAVAGPARDLAGGPVPAGPAAPISSLAAALPGAPLGPVGLDPPGEALLTAPRRTTAPIAVAKVLGVAPLAPEPPRKKRIAVSELLESASGPISSVAAALPGLDEEIDVVAALARARALAGGGLDAELEALAEDAAAPLEISVEAASAELARQLGGNAVRRDRSARWAPPPATLPAASSEALPAAAADDEPSGVREADAAGAPEPAGAGAPEAAPTVELVAVRAALPAPEAATSPAEPAPAAAPGEPEAPGAPDHHEVQPEQIADEIHRLGELDLEEVEHTELGDVPVAPGEARGEADEPAQGDHAMLAARLAAQLAEAEAEAEADLASIAAALGAATAGGPVDGYINRGDYDAGPADGGPIAQPLELVAATEEIEEFEILAEADAEDEDLLAAHGEQDASDSRVVSELDHAAPSEARPASELDFAARLDLDDDSGIGELSTQSMLERLHDDSVLDGLDPAARRDPLLDSAGQALAVFDDGDEADEGDEIDDLDVPGSGPLFGPESTGSFTIAGIPSDSLDLEGPGPPAPVIHAEPAGGGHADRGPHAARPAEPAILRGEPSPLPSLYPEVDDDELEHALEALDVDFDDLSLPHASGRRSRDRVAPAPAHTPAPSRMSTPASSRAAPARAPAPAPARAPVAMPARAPAPRAAVPMPSRTAAPAPLRASVPMPSRTAAPASSRTAPASSRAARPPAASAAPGAPASGAPASGRPRAPRVTTEDGVVIDFDDDE
ncbi:MAG TPA: hypothetical protein VFT22_24910 [Kofleriaceae bacterium]|nr:hypothetical protein [Kofleriaceae bacterium]